MERGVFKVKNVSGGTLELAEIAGHELADQAELDFLDDELPTYYEDYEAIKKASQMATTGLYAQLQAGDLIVVEDVPPLNILQA